MEITKTAGEELLIHKPDGKGGYINIIIDEGGDIELLHIMRDRKDTMSKFPATIDEAIRFWNNDKII